MIKETKKGKEKVDQNQNNEKGFRTIGRRCTNNDCKCYLDNGTNTCPRCGNKGFSTVVEVDDPRLLSDFNNFCF
ncbi:hypothetical protein ACFLZ9_00270 [Patescibacteria group bacterium]